MVMKVLMLNPPYVKDFCRSARWAAKSRGRVQRHPDWMLIAAGVLERGGHEVKFIDGPAQGLERGDIEKAISKFRPDMTVCHTTTPSIYNDIGYAKLSKELTGSQTVLIGPHVSAVPDNTFEIAKDSVDVVVRGEYDYTLLDLADGTDLSKVKGISYKKGKVFHNGNREPVDVNTLPFPSWKHIKPEWYWDGGKLYPFLTLLSGRGCFGRCTFCRDMNVMYGRAVRLRDAGKVVDEIEHDYGLYPKIKEVMFETDTFTVTRKHVQDVCNEIINRKLDITWSCNVRVDVDLDLLPLMKKAGCRMLMVGFEFGSQQALDAVKKDVRLQQSVDFARKAHDLGFIIHGCFMIGAPRETRETARKTIDFAKSLPLDTIQVSGICVYPGTPLYEWARENNYLTASDWKDWVNQDYEQVTLLSYPQLSKKEIDEFIDKGLREFYLRPGQMARMASNIRSVGDVKRKLFGLKSFVDYFRK
jgi:anaerobic magnesium-protoporphyrin IX monomethyl ester cyclase